MPRITTHSGSPNATLRYYFPKEMESQVGYFNGGPDFQMQWFGKGAQQLGLVGQVDPKDFQALLDNRDPRHPNESLSPRMRADRRQGWDCCFVVPKTVSVAFIDGDVRITDALRESVNETLSEMEHDVMVRLRKGGVKDEVKSGNLVAAVNIHPEARAVQGHAPDPNLHVHAFISNHSFTDQWYAADISHIWKDAQTYYEAIFQSRFAERLQALGYPVERSKHNFEIAPLASQSGLIERFSKRSQQIQERIEAGDARDLAAKYGVTLAEAKGWMGGRTRDPKKGDWSLAELQQAWREQLTPAEAAELDRLSQAANKGPVTQPGRVTAKQAVDYALEHGFEQESVLRERKVLADAIFYGIADNSVEDIRAELGGRELIRQGKDEAAVLTTKELQQEERDIIQFERRGRGTCKSIYPQHEIQDKRLSTEQRHVVSSLLRSQNRIELVAGKAGVGKSTLLTEYVGAARSAGVPVAMMAPTQKATDNLCSDGFEATTLQSFLLSEKVQQQIKGGVIVLDESGLVDSASFHALTRVAEREHARIVAVGDDRQHAPIGHGHPTRLLQKNGLKPLQVDTIRRQDGAYREAVVHLSNGEISEGLAGLLELGYVHEEPDDETRYTALAKSYAEAAKKYKPSELLAIAATHAERQALNDVLRRELKALGVIKADDHQFTTYLPKQLTAAERRDPLNYAIGDRIAFHSKGAGGIEPGDQRTVTSVTKDQVFADGQAVPLDAAKGFGVYRPQTAGYAVGDVVRITRGRRKTEDHSKLTNGSLHTITRIDGNNITLDHHHLLRGDDRFFDHGRVVTSVVSQGTTVKRAWISASSLSFPASDAASMYVSASRAKSRVDIHTDNFEGLERAVSRLRPKMLATDIQPSNTESASMTVRKSLGGRVNRLKAFAHRIATGTLQRVEQWFQPSRQLQPQPER